MPDGPKTIKLKSQTPQLSRGWFLLQLKLLYQMEFLSWFGMWNEIELFPSLFPGFAYSSNVDPLQSIPSRNGSNSRGFASTWRLNCKTLSFEYNHKKLEFSLCALVSCVFLLQRPIGRSHPLSARMVSEPKLSLIP